MYDLVADVKRYPEFLPWCIALRVISTDKANSLQWVIADMVVSYKVFREKFRSKVTLDPDSNVIDVEYIDGPFKNLKNKWRFNDLPDGGSQVFFEIDFEFRNLLLQKTAQTVFEKAFTRMSEAFVERAQRLYGA